MPSTGKRATTSAATGRVPLVLALALAIVAAFLLRVVNWHNILTPAGVRLIENDCFYHMRRVFLALANNLRVPGYDPFMNFPQGLHCNWPPLFDQMIAACAWLIGCGHPSAHLIETVGAFFPCMLGALTVPVVFLLARTYMRTGFAVAAAFALAVLPYHIQVSVLGRPDHHVAVVLFSSLLYLGVAGIAGSRTRAGRLLLSAVTGVLLFINLVTWVGSIMFAVILVIHFGLSALVNFRRPERLAAPCETGAIVFLVASVLLWPVAMNTYWGRLGQTSWDGLSGFHVSFLVCGAAALMLTGLLLRLLPPGRLDGAARRAPAILAAVLLVAAIVALLGGSLLPALSQSPEWILKQDPFMRHIEESGGLTWRAAMENFTGLVFLFPVIVLVLAQRQWKQDRREMAVFVLVWSAVTGACAVMQERFSDVFSVNAAILIAAFLPASADLIPPRMAGGSALRRTLASKAPMLGCVAILCLALTPTAHWLRSYWTNARALQVGRTLYDVCFWLRDNTPDPSPAPRDRHDVPAYGVLASWPMGNAIAYLGQRPNVANNFVGWPENRESNLTPYRFFVSDNVEEAEAILETCRARYVIAEDTVTSGHFARMLDVLGLRHEDYFATESSAAGPVFVPGDRTLRSMASRLYLHNGEGLPHFRLVYESPEQRTVAGRRMGVYKVFEFPRAAGNTR